MSARVEVRDLGVGKLRAELRKLADHVVTIGWQGPTGAKVHGRANVSVATLAAIHEYGTEHVRARPSLRTMMDRHGDSLRGKIKRATAELIDGRAGSAEEALVQVGQAGVAALRATIDDARGWAAPLAESTARAKGHSQPLVESFELRESSSYAVRIGSASGQIVKQGGAT